MTVVIYKRSRLSRNTKWKVGLLDKNKYVNFCTTNKDDQLARFFKQCFPKENVTTRWKSHE